MLIVLTQCLLQSNLSVTVEVEDVNSSPYFESVDTDISLVEVTHPGYAREANSVHVVCV